MSRNEKKRSYPEVWGGIECTIARVGNDYYDQLAAAGHYDRSSDIRHLTELGFKAFRYPILWERHEPSRGSEIDWSMDDHQLQELRNENITPIVGLLHHGSGPAYTDLLRDDFAEDLAAYAGRVAARYPWIEHYTPVNEPLTTARFSGLYGLWYPHETDALQCMRMLFNQLKGVVRAMAAIRCINPNAQLVQTEDLAFIQSSPSLSYQADFENQRRWLSYDLLCGKVRPDHVLWGYLIHIGIKEDDLLFFIHNSCPPDVLGVNYYVTSERFLDSEIAKYPSSACGGNGKDVYADVAIAGTGSPLGLLNLLQQVWDRYHLPIAITESHLNCTREQQLRWLDETWRAACKARDRKIDLRAVTFWALMGAHDWNTLMTQRNGYYESGAYTIKAGILTITAVGELIKMLADTGSCDHPLLEGPGWWREKAISDFEKRSPSGTLLIIGKPNDCRPWLQACFDRGIECKSLFLTASGSPLAEWQDMVQRYNAWGLIVASDIDLTEAAMLDSFDEQGIACLVWRNVVDTDESCIQTVLDLFIDEAFTTSARNALPNTIR